MRRLISIAILSLILFACSDKKSSTAVGTQGDTVEDKEQIAEENKERVEDLIEHLDDKNKRIDALKELGKIGDPSALPQVTQWLEERGLWQPEAAYTLGLLGDPTAVPALIAGLDYAVGTGTDKYTRARNRTNLNIAKALTLLNAKDSAPSLVRLLDTPDLSTREGVMRALGRLGNPIATKELVKIATTETQPFLRKVAIQALGNLGDPAAVPVLINSLYTELPGVSFYYEARHALIQIGQPAVGKLIITLERRNPSVEGIRLPSGGTIAAGAIEGKVAFVLGALQATQTTPHLIAAMNKYHGLYKNRTRVPVFASVPAAVAEIAYSLGSMGDSRAAAPLTKLARESNPTIRAAATEALAEVGDSKVIPKLFDYMRTADSSGQASLLNAISILGAGSDLKAFDALATGTDEASKQRAKSVNRLRGRLEAAGTCKSDVTCWREKLKDPSAPVRQRAAIELGRAQDLDSVDALLTTAEDDVTSVRIASVNALSRIGRVDISKLESIHNTWAKKIEYKDANQSLKRLIAVLQTHP